MTIIRCRRCLSDRIVLKKLLYHGIEVLRIWSCYYRFPCRSRLQHILSTVPNQTAADKDDLRQRVGSSQFTDSIEQDDRSIAIRLRRWSASLHKRIRIIAKQSFYRIES